MAPRIAFLLIVHGDPDLALRLCARLCAEPNRHHVFLHVDAKATDFPVERFAALPQVTLLAERWAIYWSSFPMAQAVIALLRAATRSTLAFSHHILLSGACYPIKPISSLEAHLANHPERQFIQLVPVRRSSKLANLVARRWRMTPFLPWRMLASRPRLAAADLLVRRVRNRLARLVPRRLEREIGQPVHFGSAWWALTDPCARYVVGRCDRPRFLDPFRSVFCPEELVFPTAIAGSPFVAAASGPFEDEGLRTLYAAPLHLIHPTGDRAFGNTDADFALIRADPRFFARKLSSTANAPLLDRIDRELLRLDPDASREATATPPY